MSRYIDADALAKEIKQDIADAGLTERFVFYRINEAPSIDLVLCKECKKRKKNKFCLEHKRYEKNDNGFCSYGERLQSLRYASVTADTPQTGCYITEDRDTQVLDAWQVKLQTEGASDERP